MASNMKTIKLVAENSSPIVGIQLHDGTFSEFECKFSRSNGEYNFVYLLPEGMVKKVLTVKGENVLLDALGNEWLSSDVEYHSTPPL